MTDREDKLKALEQKTSNMITVGDEAYIKVKDFVDVLEKRVDNLKDVLNSGLELTNLEDLVRELESLTPLAESVAKLEKGLLEFKIPEIPESIELSNLGEITKAIREIKPTIKLIKESDIYATYKPSDVDETDRNYKYYGFVNANGGWFILRQFGSDRQSFRYANGSSDYEGAWGTKSKQNYVLYSDVSL